MNLFTVDEDPRQAAIALGDKHIVKMLLETTQMLSNKVYDGLGITSWRQVQEKNLQDEVLTRFIGFPRRDENGNSLPYRPAHWNHPVSQWVRLTRKNWLWTWKHAIALSDEYTYRFGKIHGCEKILIWLYDKFIRNQFIFSVGGLTEFKMCFEDQYKKYDSPILNHRENYKFGKAHLHRWTRRKPPQWINY